MDIIETPPEEGGAQNELTVNQMAVVPETRMPWLRIISGTDLDIDRLIRIPGDSVIR